MWISCHLIAARPQAQREDKLAAKVVWPAFANSLAFDSACQHQKQRSGEEYQIPHSAPVLVRTWPENQCEQTGLGSVRLSVPGFWPISICKLCFALPWPGETAAPHTPRLIPVGLPLLPGGLPPPTPPRKLIKNPNQGRTKTLQSKFAHNRRRRPGQGTGNPIEKPMGGGEPYNLPLAHYYLPPEVPIRVTGHEYQYPNKVYHRSL